MELELPDLETQKAIADFLDRETARVDQLIEKKQRLVAAVGVLRQSHILHQLSSLGAPQTDVAPESYRTGIFKGGWSIRRIKSLVGLMTSGSRGWSDLISDDGELFLQSGNIGREMDVSIDNATRVAPQSGAEADRTRLANGDILVCITGGRTGAVGFLEAIAEPAYVNQHVCLLRASTRSIDPKLLAYLLFSDIGQRQLDFFQYGLKQGLGFSQVGEVKVPVPPRDAHSKIVTALDSYSERIGRVAEQVLTSIDLLREFRVALITAAVTGQIDVATWGKRGNSDRWVEQIEADFGRPNPEAT